MIKPAPGPWKIEGEFDADVSVTILDAAGDVVFELEPQGPAGWDEPAIANARLMIAAPELLKATQAAWHLCESLLASRHGATDELIGSVSDALQFAITRAQGRL